MKARQRALLAGTFSKAEPFGRECSDNMELGIATAFVENTNAAIT
jgi:hypothetical protein